MVFLLSYHVATIVVLFTLKKLMLYLYCIANIATSALTL